MLIFSSYRNPLYTVVLTLLVHICSIPFISCTSSHNFWCYESVNCNLCIQYKKQWFQGRWNCGLGCYDMEWQSIWQAASVLEINLYWIVLKILIQYLVTLFKIYQIILWGVQCLNQLIFHNPHISFQRKHCNTGMTIFRPKCAFIRRSEIIKW
jgi:hypothetical protein